MSRTPPLPVPALSGGSGPGRGGTVVDGPSGHRHPDEVDESVPPVEEGVNPEDSGWESPRVGQPESPTHLPEPLYLPQSRLWVLRYRVGGPCVRTGTPRLTPVRPPLRGERFPLLN